MIAKVLGDKHRERLSRVEPLPDDMTFNVSILSSSDLE